MKASTVGHQLCLMPLHKEEELQAWHCGPSRFGLPLSRSVGIAVLVLGHARRQRLWRGLRQDIAVPWQFHETWQIELPPRGRSYPHGMGVPAGDMARNDTNPCLTAPAWCAGVNFYQSTDGQGGSSRQGPGDAIFGSGKDGTAGDRNFPNPAFSALPYFGGSGGPAAGSSGGAGENGGSSPNNGRNGGGSAKGSGDPSDGGAPSFNDPDPGTTSPPNQPGSGSLPISQFVPGDPPNDPPGQGNPNSSTGAPQYSSPDLQAGSDPQDSPITIPEPSTFWLFVGSMGSAFAALRLSRRARST